MRRAACTGAGAAWCGVGVLPSVVGVHANMLTHSRAPCRSSSGSRTAAAVSAALLLQHTQHGLSGLPLIVMVGRGAVGAWGWCIGGECRHKQSPAVEVA